ncbi:unnamed protein product [Closterium sp. NIES-65]|nr:unnamed protein product [Closterium sp. NIES-65]
MANPLLTPFTLPDGTELSMRMVYAPLTRDRALGTIPQPNASTYYSHRAHKGGLMLTEGMCISPKAHGYPDTPGIYTEAQIAAWKPVIKAVHDKGARFYCQLWHDGSNKCKDEFGGSLENRLRFPLQVIKAVADVAIKAVGARKMIKAVADEVGASKVFKAVADEVGVRLSLYSTFLDETDSDPVATYVGLVERLNGLGLAYVHFIEARVRGNDDMEVEKEVSGCEEGREQGNDDLDVDKEVRGEEELPCCEGSETLEPFRKAFKGPFIAAGGFKRESGMAAIESGAADLITYGRLFLANPDLPRRFELNAPLNAYDRITFFIPDQVKGYIDYPFLEEPKKAE